MTAATLQRLRTGFLIAATLLILELPAGAADFTENWFLKNDEAVARALGKPVAAAQSRKQRGYRFTLYANPKTGLLEYFALYYRNECIGIVYMALGRIDDVATAQILQNHRGDSSWVTLGVEHETGTTPDGQPTEGTFKRWRRKDRKLYAGNCWIRGGNIEFTMFLLGNSRAAKTVVKVMDEMVALFTETGQRILKERQSGGRRQRG